MRRIIIVGGPGSGKSTLARKFRAEGLPTFCGDPRSKAKEVEPNVTYLPEGLPFAGDGGGSDWVAQNWFTMPGNWLLEGQIMARALRRWTELGSGTESRYDPFTKIIVLNWQHRPNPLPGQLAMAKGVMTVWNGIKHRFPSTLVEYK
jgi:hypothetical protein